jgi:hypothetical protein
MYEQLKKIISNIQKEPSAHFAGFNPILHCIIIFDKTCLKKTDLLYFILFIILK